MDIDAVQFGLASGKGTPNAIFIPRKLQDVPGGRESSTIVFAELKKAF